ncbi:hypothetical protein M8J76_000032 [Diaphorina citri]|nr:hypothetical protein M8J76_000032 [Diaphorina citri]
MVGLEKGVIVIREGERVRDLRGDVNDKTGGGSISNIDDTEYHCNKTQIRKVISGVVGAASSVTSIQVANLLRLFKIPQETEETRDEEEELKLHDDDITPSSMETGTECSGPDTMKTMTDDAPDESIVSDDSGIFETNTPELESGETPLDSACDGYVRVSVPDALEQHVSFWSTSPELSNKQRFEYFTRTIPSDHHQVKAMVEIVKKLGWSYVSIIYEESNYGVKAFEELEVLLAKYSICIAIKEKLVKDSGVAEETAYDDIVLKLLTKPRARGVIVFGSDQEVAGMMRAVRRMNATGNFSWVGSDGWSARGLVSDGSEAEVEGTLSLQPQANPVRGFDEYFLNLTVENNRRDPWFIEFWEDHFKCKYPNGSRTPYNTEFNRTCTGKEKLSHNNTAFENQLQFVSDAVMAFAHALNDMHKELCHGKKGLCEAMKPTKGSDLLKYLRLSGDKFKFDANGDGPARYNIIHFKEMSPGSYEWVRVGEYVEGELRLNLSEIQFKAEHPRPPESVCSLPCDRGQAKQYLEGESCCWHCFNCTQYHVRSSTDETKCVICPEGTKPNVEHTECLEVPEVYLKYESHWAIGAMGLSTMGILITAFIGLVFIRHNDTPVVKAAGRELSYVLLTGILMCYLVTFVLVMKPTDIVCGVQRFGTGFCFTVVYAALLTKTNRISRIFNAGKRTVKRPSFISPKSQLIICTGMISVQVLINGVWMVLSPPRAIHHYPTREDNLLVCASFISASYMIAFGYPIVLIVVCTVYAVLTRNIPEAFNESKHIGFTMYTTCVIWLAFVPLYFGTGNHMPLRITTMSVTISLSASVTVACLFSPKLYIILIRPDQNVRQSMMPTSRYKSTSGPTIVTNNAHTNDLKKADSLKMNCLEKPKPPLKSVSTQTSNPGLLNGDALHEDTNLPSKAKSPSEEKPKAKVSTSCEEDKPNSNSKTLPPVAEESPQVIATSTEDKPQTKPEELTNHKVNQDSVNNNVPCMTSSL